MFHSFYKFYFILKKLCDATSVLYFHMMVPGQMGGDTVVLDWLPVKPQRKLALC